MGFKYESLSPAAERRRLSLLQRYRVVVMVLLVLALWFLTTITFGTAWPFNGTRSFNATRPFNITRKKTWEPLRFDENGKFQLAIFEDLHFGESKSNQML